MHFFACHDIQLLKEVLAIRPENPDGWKVVAANLNKIEGFKVQARTCKEHTGRILKQFKSDDLGNLRKSGTDEEFNEKERLLQELVELEREREEREKENQTKAPKVPKCKEQESKREQGAVIHEAAMMTQVNANPSTAENTQESDDESEKEEEVTTPKPKKQRVTKQSVFSYLSQKNDVESQARKEELSLRREELQLQKEKLDLEKREKEHRWRMEEEANQRRQEMDVKMMELINSLIQKKSSE